MTSESTPIESPAESPAEKPDNSDTGQAAPPAPGRGLVWLALLIALAALGLGVQQYLAPADSSAVASDPALDALQGRLDQLEGKAGYNAENLERLTGRLDTQLAGLEALPERIDRFEQTLNELPQSNTETTGYFLQLETDWYLRLAESQMLVAGNTETARQALLLADERLATLANPRLIPIRNRIAAATAELELITTGVSAGQLDALQKLIEAIPRWPLRSDVPTSYRGEPEIAADAEGWDRAVDALKSAVGSVIDVRESDTAIAPQLSKADIDLLRKSMELDLQLAKVALLRNNRELVATTLNAVTYRLQTWFDTTSPAVSDALTIIDELRLELGRQTLPDVSEIREAYEQLTGSAAG